MVVSINCLSAKLSSMVINFFTVAKLMALVIIIIVGFIEMGKGKYMTHQVKTQYLQFRFLANYFLLPCKISEEISRRSMLFHN